MKHTPLQGTDQFACFKINHIHNPPTITRDARSGGELETDGVKGEEIVLRADPLSELKQLLDWIPLPDPDFQVAMCCEQIFVGMKPAGVYTLAVIFNGTNAVARIEIPDSNGLVP